MAGYRRVQGHAMHREGGRTGRFGQSALFVGLQFVGSRHVGHLLSDQGVLATARVARRRRLVFVYGEDNRRRLQVFAVLFGPNEQQSEPYGNREPDV